MIQRILVPIAPGQDVNSGFHQILQFANKVQAKVTLLTVIEDLTPLRVAVDLPVSGQDILELAERAYADELKSKTSTLEKIYPQVDFDTEVATGMPFLIIIQRAREEFDLVAIDANRGGKKSAVQYGSTTRHLMRKSETPVWVITREGKQRVDQVIAAVDVAPPSEEGKALNKGIIEMAALFANIYDVELTLFHSWQLSGVSFLTGLSTISEGELAEWAGKEEEERRERLVRLSRTVSDKVPEINFSLQQGDTRDLLPAMVADKPEVLLVMGTLCRSGIPGFLIGNTAETVLESVSCSVLTLKPEDFESPVR